MRGTHAADVYNGTLSLVAVRPDKANKNMVFALVVRDTRNKLHTGQRIWIAAKQVSSIA